MGGAKTLVLLVRHGHTPTTGKVLPGRAEGLELSEKGQEQAIHAGERIIKLVDSVISAGARGEKESMAASHRTTPIIYASPMLRTQQTALPIAASCGVEVTTLEGINECDFGDWTGAELAELRKLPEWKTVQETPSKFAFPGGESFAGMQERAVGAIGDVVGRHPGGIIVAVSHADVIKSIVADAMGTPLDHFQKLFISPCSISAVVYESVSHPSDKNKTAMVLTANSIGDDLGRLPIRLGGEDA